MDEVRWMEILHIMKLPFLGNLVQFVYSRLLHPFDAMGIGVKRARYC